MSFCPNCGYQPVCSNCGHQVAGARFCVVCGAALIESMAPVAESGTPQSPGDCVVSAADLEIDAEEQILLGLINQYRAQHGLNVLSFGKPALNQAAAWLSRDMATNNYLSHTDSNGRTLDRLNWCGASFTTVAENIAAGPADAASVFDIWTNSPDHRANMLRDGVSFAGIAHAFNANTQYGWYWTLDVSD